jgi:hypothetical protein
MKRVITLVLLLALSVSASLVLLSGCAFGGKTVPVYTGMSISSIMSSAEANAYLSDGRYKIFADIGGGYLRIYDTQKRCHVDAYGNDVRNYVDSRGKQHGRSKAEQKALTHFRILKREEM